MLGILRELVENQQKDASFKKNWYGLGSGRVTKKLTHVEHGLPVNGAPDEECGIKLQ